MARIAYCELEESFCKKYNYPKYVIVDGIDGEKGIFSAFSKIYYSADRIWVQMDNESVRYFKHRFVDPETTPVDMKEFMFVKLSSVLLK